MKSCFSRHISVSKEVINPDLNYNSNSRNHDEKFHGKEGYDQLDNASQADFLKNKTEMNSDFGISAIDLETLMGYYKERGSDFADLKYFETIYFGKMLK